MKLLFCILALYITLLPAIPCRDSEDGCKDEMARSMNDNDQQDHKEKDACSPFCACTCCQVSNNIVNFTPLISILPLPQLPAFKWPAREGDINDRSASIWQPPRLGRFLI